MNEAIHIYLQVIIAGLAGYWAYGVGTGLVALVEYHKKYGRWIWQRYERR